jgi:hypothetical protein
MIAPMTSRSPATWLSHFLVRRSGGSRFSSLFGGLGGTTERRRYGISFSSPTSGAGRATDLAREADCWAAHPTIRSIGSRQPAEDTIKRVVDLKRPGRCLPDRRRITRYVSARTAFFDLSTFEPVRSRLRAISESLLSGHLCETAPCCLRALDPRPRRPIWRTLSLFRPSACRAYVQRSGP